MGSMTLEFLLIAAGIGGYLLGSIPFGLVITRMLGLGDIRFIGSGNIGATNVLRTATSRPHWRRCFWIRARAPSPPCWRAMYWLVP